MINVCKKILPLLVLPFCACTNEENMTDRGLVICPGYDVLSVPVAPPKEPSAPLSELSKSAIDGCNRFAVDFYLANSKNGKENVCLSPFSVSNVLGMLANGDNGESRNEILRLLGFEQSETGLAALNAYHSTLLSNLPNLSDTECVFTNSIWHEYFIPIYPDFNQTISKYFYAKNFDISPEGEEGKEAINQFVKTNTYGIITDFLDAPIDSSVAFLNTAYFKGSWQDHFDKDFNQQRIFMNSDMSKSKVDFMQNLIYCEYAVTEDGYEAVRIPLGESGQNFSMTLMLPSSQANRVALNPDEVFEKGILEEYNERFKFEQIRVILPKFEASTKNSNTIDILKTMGLDKVCEPTAGFPNIVDYHDPFFLNCFIHAAKLIVNEEGTEGAAASIGGQYGSNGNGSQNSCREIVFDRPFGFMIQERSTGAILFIGSVKKL